MFSDVFESISEGFCAGISAFSGAVAIAAVYFIEVFFCGNYYNIINALCVSAGVECVLNK